MCVARLAALREGLSPVADGTELVKMTFRVEWLYRKMTFRARLTLQKMTIRGMINAARPRDS